jgi:hypothetical protein
VQANQRLFKEMGFVPPLLALLTSAVPQGAVEALSAAPANLPGGGAAADPMAALSSAAAVVAASAVSAAAALTQADRAAHLVHTSPETASILLCVLEAVQLLVRCVHACVCGCVA